MGRLLRIQDKDTIYFLTNRCLEERFFLRPSPEVNELILGWLARAAAIHKVKLLFFIFMSNHFHLGAQAPKENIERFMGHFQSALARNLNTLLGRSGPIFARRYSAEPILDDASLLQKMIYTLNNPVRAGLVECIEDWPGISSFSAHMSGAPITARWLNREELRRIRRRRNSTTEMEEEAYEFYEMELMCLPAFAAKSHEEWSSNLRELVAAGAESEAKTRKRKKVLGPAKVLKQDCHRRPSNPDFSERPLCHTTCASQREEYRKMVADVTHQYRVAMKRWREGKTEMRFPRGTIPPGWKRCVQKSDLVVDKYEDFG
ncbi:MAG: transposase [Bradymonadaceae bacterium]